MSLLTDNRNPEPPTSSRRPPGHWRELASRRSTGLGVGLYWRQKGDEIFVQVSDEQTGESFVFEAPKSTALAAFYDPYAFWGEEVGA